jgi:predicted Zn-dependent protease with MMP-like domain
MLKDIDKSAFEKEVLLALESLPEEFKEKLENINIIIEDTNPSTGSELILGLYHGIPLKNRGIYYSNVLPDRIILYSKNIKNISRTKQELRKNIKKVIIHEVAHYFGFEEDTIRKIGY